MAKWEGAKPGNGPMGATQNALNEAWRKAKDDGKAGVELRVAEWYVTGENPLNWARVVLTDDGAADTEADDTKYKDEEYSGEETAA